MKSLMELEFDGLPPTVNHIYRGNHGWRYLTPETREFQERITAMLCKCWDNKPTFTEAASLFITFYTNNRKRWDIDNRVKALQDCIERAGIIKDDTQIDLLHVERVHCDKVATRLVLAQCTIN